MLLGVDGGIWLQMRFFGWTKTLDFFWWGFQLINGHLSVRCHHRSLEESLGIQPKNWGCNKHWFWRASKTATCRLTCVFFLYPPKPWVSILERPWISWLFWMIWGYHPFSDTHFERAERAKVTIQKQITWICSRWRLGDRLGREVCHFWYEMISNI